jgi:hypothetical protein
LTRGRAATSDPFDLSAIRRSDELFDALSSRRSADLSAGCAESDPAVRLLAALAADVDAGAPPLPTSARAACVMPGAHRRGVRAFVTFGVAAIVLTSAGAAAAGGGGGATGATARTDSVRFSVSERSNHSLRRQEPAAPPRAGRRSGTPQASPLRRDTRSVALPPARHGAHAPGNKAGEQPVPTPPRGDARPRQELGPGPRAPRGSRQPPSQTSPGRHSGQNGGQNSGQVGGRDNGQNEGRSGGRNGGRDGGQSGERYYGRGSGRRNGQN